MKREYDLEVEIQIPGLGERNFSGDRKKKRSKTVTRDKTPQMHRMLYSNFAAAYKHTKNRSQGKCAAAGRAHVRAFS